MKLLVLIGTDYHLRHLPHFLHHYHRLGVDRFLCGLHGRRIAEARRILADYPVEIVADYGDTSFRGGCQDSWKASFNLFRRQRVQPGEWCLYADADEFHEYPADFFAALDPEVNAVMGRWVERLATPDGQLRACRPYGNLGEQFPFATREIFCGISYKVMATRGGLDVAYGYHYFFGPAQVFSRLLNVHHFRRDDLAAAKYRDRVMPRNEELGSERVPDLRGVFAVDPPFPADAEGLPPPPPMTLEVLSAPGHEAAPENPNLVETQPPVSCFCLTYGRPRLLEEAIYSFLRQDYTGPKELIVLNDYADQILELDHPEVRVINLPKRFRTLGEKMNAAVALASHDLIFTWDDDDVYLPHRLSFSVASFDPGKGFFKAASAWLWSNGSLSGPVAQVRFHAACCWSRALFDAIGGYAADGSGTDAIFERELEASFPGSTAFFDVTPEEIYYVYRWGGTGSHHLSSFGAAKPGQNFGYAEFAARVEQQARRGEIPLGRVVLQPHWNHDYPQLIANRLAAR